MRFDKVVELLIYTIVDDGQGGRTQQLELHSTAHANVEELSVIDTYKIYGEATTDSIKVRLLGRIDTEIDNIRYDDKLYRIISKRYVRNKTVFLLELVEDAN